MRALLLLLLCWPLSAQAQLFPDRVMARCAGQWRLLKNDQEVPPGLTWPGFLAQCGAGKRVTPTVVVPVVETAAAADAPVAVAPARPESWQKACGKAWRAAKKAGTTEGRTWAEFKKTCAR
jgi:hypothetical protein